MQKRLRKASEEINLRNSVSWACGGRLIRSKVKKVK